MNEKSDNFSDIVREIDDQKKETGNSLEVSSNGQKQAS